MPGGMAGPFRLGKVQTRNACFHQLRTRTVPVQIWGSDIKIKNDPFGSLFILAAPTRFELVFSP